MMAAMRALGLLVLIGAGCGGPGDDWVEVGGVPELFAIHDVWAFAPDDVIAVGSGGTVLDYDGATWRAVQTAEPSDLTGIWAFARDEVWLTANQSVLRWDGAAWTVEDLSMFGVDGLTDLWGASPEDLWAVGDDGIFLHRGAGGVWTSALTQAVFNHAVWGSGPADVYALGTFDVLHYDGAGWTAIDDPTLFGGEGDIWGTGPDDVWIATDDDHLAHWD